MNPFIVADARKCIGCRTCEVACVVAHQAEQDCAAVSREVFFPRIQVVKGDTFSSAVACHQCEDAPCMNVCPTGAIRRENAYIAVEQNRCIGCKSCMVACPFGAMRVVVQNARSQAIKCDLCKHRAQGPACVEACPTSALRCVDTSKISVKAKFA
ncbi:4Fe-4S binding protein [Pseudocitrobacter cyperus]|uniref:4Fe-4S binding protein n=1 Tax=Pseudocitrobacter cyperus TaxID=3112843 RepID=A0ABV0HMF5_9ENTR